jgi:hypothetical protein
MTLSPQRLEKAAEAVYRKFEDRPLYAQAQMNGIIADELARAAISAYLGDDMVVMPRQICDHEWGAFPVDARGNMICVVEPTRSNWPSAAFCIKCHMKAPPLSAELTERDAG